MNRTWRSTNSWLNCTAKSCSSVRVSCYAFDVLAVSAEYGVLVLMRNGLAELQDSQRQHAPVAAAAGTLCPVVCSRSLSTSCETAMLPNLRMRCSCFVLVVALLSLCKRVFALCFIASCPQSFLHSWTYF